MNHSHRFEIEALETRRLLSAGAPRMIAELSKAGVNPSDIVVAPSGQIFFSGDDGIHGRELWTSDGTAAGTKLLKDVVPGKHFSEPHDLVTIGDKLFFIAYDDATTVGLSVYRSDGTAAGTTRFFHQVDKIPEHLTVVAGSLVFDASQALTKCNPQTGAFVQIAPKDDLADVKQIIPATSGCYVVRQINAFDPDYVLSYSNLTTSETSLDDLGPYNNADERGPLVVVSGQRAFYFSYQAGRYPADSLNHTYDLWTTTGSKQSGRLVTPMLRNATMLAADPRGHAFFTVAGKNGPFLGVSDGTAGGTGFPISSAITNLDLMSPSRFAQFNGETYFIAGGLWKSDGTPSGTTPILPGPRVDDLGDELIATSSTLYIHNQTYTNAKLLKVDLSARSVRTVVDDLPLDQNLGNPAREQRHFTVTGGRLLFHGYASPDLHHLWSTDGTNAGTHAISPTVASTGGSYPAHFVRFNGRTFFAALAGSPRLFSTDDHSVVDTGVELQLYENELVVGKNAIFFIKNRDVWKTDGTLANTAPVTALSTSPFTGYNASARHLTRLGKWIYFLVNAAGSNQLWRTDGSAKNTGRVGALQVTSEELVVAGTRVYFTAKNKSRGTELWSTDGASDPTLVRDIAPGAIGSNPTKLTAAGDALYFLADDATRGPELWTTQPSTGVTHLVRDIKKGAKGVAINGIAPAAGKVLFVVNANQLWATDSQYGAVFIKQIADAPGPDAGDAFRNLATIVGGDQIAYCAVRVFDSTGEYQYFLTRTDGTAAGTKLLSRTETSDIIAVGNHAYFTQAPTSGNNHTLWTSDGTTTGTHIINSNIMVTVDQGTSDYANVASFTLIGDALYLLANDQIHGAEPWIIQPPT